MPHKDLGRFCFERARLHRPSNRNGVDLDGWMQIGRTQIGWRRASTLQFPLATNGEINTK
ncbi:MAG: hypothetical protein JWN45_2831 [Acidobacteriaceae bacterium]|nr:hypothetical protein [Acidobacteriaceae bacterium]